MTTKRFLLDLLDAEERRVRDGQDEVIKTWGDTITTLASYRQIKLNYIEKARRFVEKGHEEP